MTDWVTRNMQEKETDPIKWAGGVGPGAPVLKPRRGVVRPPGHHTKWKSPEERELDRAWKELHTRQREDVEKWPGPFQKRTDYPSYRPAYWLNCPVCSVLFISNVSESKTPNVNRFSGERAKARYCSLSCAGNASAKPIFRVCSYCATTFRVFQRNYNKRTCCNNCARSVQGEQMARNRNMGLIQYAFESGKIADHTTLTCDLCGAGQKQRGKSNRTTHWEVTIALVGGKYIARCKNCYAKSVRAKKALEAAMTPAEKLRREQAKELIKGLL